MRASLGKLKRAIALRLPVTSSPAPERHIELMAAPRLVNARLLIFLCSFVIVLVLCSIITNGYAGIVDVLRKGVTIQTSMPVTKIDTSMTDTVSVTAGGKTMTAR